MNPPEKDAASAQNNPTGFCPKPALGLEKTALPRGLLEELVLKQVFLDGTTSISRLIAATKLDYTAVEAVFRSMQREQLLNVKGVEGYNYEFSLTAKGLHSAEAAFRKSQYTGPAPVPLAAYCRAVREQAFQPRVTRTILVEKFFDLVLTEQNILDLGAAIMTGGPVFLYGPTGSGKTSLAERLHRIFHDSVCIPYAVEVSGQILTLYDPNVHHPVDPQPPDLDPRWVICRRPFLMVGGEMTAAMLEPHFDPGTRIGVAPLQMKANNGILVIDDFGRQHMSARELLNRWIVPLDRRVDYLSLGPALKFEIPFELVVVLATNLDPSHLAEEAFLRRIKNKVRVDGATPAVFLEIWQRECDVHGLGFQPDVAEYACRRCSEDGRALRACFPRDLMDIVRGVATFESRPPILTTAEVERALHLYFTHQPPAP